MSTDERSPPGSDAAPPEGEPARRSLDASEPAASAEIARDEVLPLHRVAGRAAVLGAVGGPCVSVTLLACLLSSGERVPVDEGAALVALGGAAAGTALAMLVATAELARRVRPELRLATIAAAGATSAGVILAVAVWFAAIFGSGGGPEKALTELARVAEHVLRQPREPLVTSACVLLDVVAIFASRLGVWPGLPGRIPPLWGQLGLAAVAGLLGFVLLCAVFGAPAPRERLLLVGVFMSLPASASLGLALGDRVEAGLLAWTRRLRERGD